MPAPRHAIAPLLTLLVACAPAWAAAQAPAVEALPEGPVAVTRDALRALARNDIAARRTAWQAERVARPASPLPLLALAALARVESRHEAARAALDSAAPLAAADPRWRAAVARERSAAAAARGDLLGARDAAAAAMADLAALPPDEQAWTRLLDVTTRRARALPAPLALLDTVAALVPAVDTALRVRTGCTRLAADDPARAQATFDTLAPLALAAGDVHGYGGCQLALGTVYERIGPAYRAGQAFRSADSAFLAARDSNMLAVAIQRRAALNISTGYLGAARAYLPLAMRLAVWSENAQVQGWVQFNVARAHALIGARAAATEALQRATRFLEQAGDPRGIVVVRRELARARAELGDVDGAITEYGRARAVAAANADGQGEALAISGLADMATRRGDLTRAAALLDTLELRTAGERYAWMQSLRLARARLAAQRGDWRAAREGYRLTLGDYSERQWLFRADAQAALALATWRGGDRTTAVQLLVGAADDVDRVRNDLSTGELRTTLAARRSGWGGSGDEGDVLLAAMATTGFADAAFALAERARARSLVDRVLTVGADSAAIWRVRGTTIAWRDLPAVRAALPADRALLVYAGGSGAAPTTLLVVTRGGVRGLALAPLDTLDALVARWNALLEAGDAGRGAGTALARAILGPALAAIPAGVRQLLVVPQGALHRVPWGALPLGRGVVADRWQVATAPSVTVAMRALREPVEVMPRVLAIGAGDATQPDAAPGALGAERGTTLAPLAATGDEARIATAWAPGSLALVDASATETALRREATGTWTVLHAAAHALTNDEALGATWLIVRPDATSDGYVSGGELATLARGRTLVVLSGCRTTGDYGSRGDTVDGLVAPLLATGVRTVVASHWAVSDGATRDLMARFYAQLARGRSVGEALATAQRDLRTTGASARTWAAFTVIGDPSVRFVPPDRGAARAGR